MTTSSETLGRRIARLRLAKTATQERLAKELNVSPQAVSKWENDINSIRTSRCCQILRASLACPLTNF